MLWMIFIAVSLLIIIQLYIAIKLKARFSDQDRRFEKLEEKINESVGRSNKILKEIQERSIEIQNSAVLSSSLDLDYPIFYDGWSIDSHLARFLVEYITVHKPKSILEFGSGTSTIVIAKIIQKLNYSAVHISIDHDKTYIEKTKLIASLNKLTNISFNYAPLQKIIISGQEYMFYHGIKEILGDNRPDLVLIDGPPGQTCKHARFPALPLIYEAIENNATIILDDYIRDDEKEIVTMWKNMYPMLDLVEVLNQGHQCAVLRKKS